MRTATRVALAAVFLASLATALAHGDDEAMDMNMDMEMGMHSSATTATATATPSASGHTNDPMSYFAYGKHSSSIIAHIALMVLGWCFVLPAGKHSIPGD